MTSLLSAFTDALPRHALVPLPVTIEGAADTLHAQRQSPWALRGYSALEASVFEASAGVVEGNGPTPFNAGLEVLRALRLRGWSEVGEYLAPTYLQRRMPTAAFSVTPVFHEMVDPEGYYLRCEPAQVSAGHEKELQVIIEAGTPAGFFYAGLTLAALAAGGALQEGCLVTDAPRFTHRGLMVDVARSFLPIEALRDLVAAVASLKMNVLHLHLVDDQGWRIEITNEGCDPADHTDYTALHRLGGLSACNPGSNPGFDLPGAAMSEVLAINAGFESIAAGIPGYYAQVELRELAAYAASMHVRLVPELEFPGHNHVVLHALPHLATAGASTQDKGDGIPPWTRWQVGHSYLDFDNEDTWRFARHVITQVHAIFGGEHLHLGGDEALKMLRNLGQNTYDEVVARVVSEAKACGFDRVSLWQEGAMALPAATDSVQLWNYGAVGEIERLMRAAADHKLRIVNSDARRVYLDQKISLDDVLGLTWACPQGLSTRQAYEWDPHDVFPANMHEQVVGVEACLWSETVRGPKDAAFLIFPRLLAIAEVAWTPQARRRWQEFEERTKCDAHGQERT